METSPKRLGRGHFQFSVFSFQFSVFSFQLPRTCFFAHRIAESILAAQREYKSQQKEKLTPLARTLLYCSVVNKLLLKTDFNKGPAMSATTLTPQPQTQTPRFRQQRKQTQLAAKRRDDVVARSEERVRLHPHFRSRNPELKFEVQQNRLIVSGRLPSYFHKQLVQEAIRDIDNLEIDNQITVAAEN